MSAPAQVSFAAGKMPPRPLPQFSRVPYVLPGAAGYLGPLAALTPYSPPGSGYPGAGNVPSVDWSWEDDGMRNDDASVTLDHAYVYGGLYLTGSSATVTNSVIQAGTGLEIAPVAMHGSGGTVTTNTCTFGWLPGTTTPNGVDAGLVWDDADYTYLLTNCDLSGAPQGAGPVAGANSQIIGCYIHDLVQNTPPLGSHIDGIFNEGAANTLVQACFIDATADGVSATAALFFQSSGGFGGCNVLGNYLCGGSFTFYNQDATGINVINNTFGGGVFGDTSNTAPGTIGTWEGNTHPDGSPVPSP